jgi:DNA-directed RNA polymerase specialized sigma24 family protein
MVRPWEQAGGGRPATWARRGSRAAANGARATAESGAADGSASAADSLRPPSGETADEIGRDRQERAGTSVKRRKADRQLYETLTQARFGGVSWDLFATELARYAHAILMAWLVTGELFQQCHAKGRSLGLPPIDWTREDRVELANETVARALNRFRDNALAGGGWSQEGGASLTTYFMGTCIYEFPNVFRRWQTEQSSWHRPDLVELTPDQDWPAISDDPCVIAVERLWIGEVLAAIPNPTTRKAVVLQSLKYTYDEIAELLNMTPGAVAQLLCRERRRQQRQPKVPHE